MKLKMIITAVVLFLITTISESSCNEDNHFMSVSIKKESDLKLSSFFVIGCKAYQSSLHEVAYINDTTEFKEGMKLINIAPGVVNVGHEFYIIPNSKGNDLYLEIEFKEIRLISHDDKKKRPKTENYNFTINHLVKFNEPYNFTKNGLEYELKIYK